MARLDDRLAALEKTVHLLLDTLQTTHHAVQVRAMREQLLGADFYDAEMAARDEAQKKAAADAEAERQRIADEVGAKNRAQQGLPPLEAAQTP